MTIPTVPPDRKRDRWPPGSAALELSQDSVVRYVQVPLECWGSSSKALAVLLSESHPSSQPPTCLGTLAGQRAFHKGLLPTKRGLNDGRPLRPEPALATY